MLEGQFPPSHYPGIAIAVDCIIFSDKWGNIPVPLECGLCRRARAAYKLAFRLLRKPETQSCTNKSVNRNCLYLYVIFSSTISKVESLHVVLESWVAFCLHFLLSFFLCSIKMHEEKKSKSKKTDAVPEGAVPAYLLDREGQSRAKVLSNMVKQKRKEKAVSEWWKTRLFSCIVRRRTCLCRVDQTPVPSSTVQRSWNVKESFSDNLQLLSMALSGLQLIRFSLPRPNFVRTQVSSFVFWLVWFVDLIWLCVHCTWADWAAWLSKNFCRYEIVPFFFHGLKLCMYGSCFPPCLLCSGQMERTIAESA